MRSAVPVRQQSPRQKNRTIRRGYVANTGGFVRWTTDLISSQLASIRIPVRVIVSENVLDGWVKSVEPNGIVLAYMLPFGHQSEEHCRLVATNRVLDHLNGAGAIRLYPTADTADKRRKAVTV